jgi:aspartyl-tRNA(Asn)/glutamyl-tRNA(Gln) amidotransferase subunit A
MDATSKNMEYPKLTDNLTVNAKGLKIGILKEYFGEGVDDSVKESVYKVVKLFEENGAEIKEISIPSANFAMSTYYIISSAEASSNLARFDGVKYGYRAKEYDSLIDMYENTRSEGFGDEVKRRIMLGTFVLSSGFYDAYYKKAKIMQKRISSEFDNVFKDIDIIISPTVVSTAFKIGENIDNPVKMYYNDAFTVTANIGGLPAISLPCAKDEKNLPIGLQLIGKKFSEQTLLNAAYTYENLCGGFNVHSQIL